MAKKRIRNLLKDGVVITAGYYTNNKQKTFNFATYVTIKDDLNPL